MYLIKCMPTTEVAESVYVANGKKEIVNLAILIA
jgi:hypothetical protein